MGTRKSALHPLAAQYTQQCIHPPHHHLVEFSALNWGNGLCFGVKIDVLNRVSLVFETVWPKNLEDQQV